MKIVHYMVQKRRKRKGKVGLNFFSRTTRLLKQDTWKKQEMVRSLCFNWNSFDYPDINKYVAHVLHTRKEQKKKNRPLTIIGDAKFPPLIQKVKRYYLIYNPSNFIGEYEMGVYGPNAFLIFRLNYPEEFKKYKEIAHSVVYLGSQCQIVFMCSSDAVLPEKIIRKESINDYHIWIVKDAGHYLPYHKSLLSFTQLIPKRL